MHGQLTCLPELLQSNAKLEMIIVSILSSVLPYFSLCFLSFPFFPFSFIIFILFYLFRTETVHLWSACFSLPPTLSFLSSPVLVSPPLVFLLLFYSPLLPKLLPPSSFYPPPMCFWEKARGCKKKRKKNA